MTGGKAVQVVFAANNSAYRSRKRAHRACEQCKSRRRKCPPPFENHERCASCAQDGIQCSLALIDSETGPPQWTAEEPRDENEDMDKSGLPDKNPRFIGDLNPESVFLAATEDSASSDMATDRNEVGVWVSQSPEPLVKSKSLKRRFQVHETSHKPVMAPAADSGPEKYLAAYISSLNAYALPTRSCVEMLLSLYLSSIHPLYPILDESSCALFKSPDKLPNVLLQSVLLVASRHPEAKSHLRLSASADPLKPQEFASRLETRIKALLYAEEVHDRMVLIRVYALLSLGGGNEDASRNLALAIHHAHSLGLHIRNSNAEELWWCLWTLDKLQAAMNGRPIFVRLEDVSIGRPTKTREGKGAAFRVMVKLAELLEAVIALYRPGNEKCWDHEFPDFAEYLQEEDVPEEGGQLAILKLFYYAISILSHRTRNPSSSQARGNSYARRLRAASDVIDLLDHSPISLPPTPILPYAVSLALTTFYARVREGDGECIAEYKGCIDKLTYLGEWWWVAGAMAKLGARAMNSGGKRRAVEKECAAVLSSLKGTQEEGKSGNVGVARERSSTHVAAVPVPTLSSPSEIRRSFYPQSGASHSPIMQTAANTSSYTPYSQVMPMPSLISMPSQVTYSPTPSFPELDDAAFTGVDIFLLDQFSNPSNPLDFGSLDFNSGWFGGETGVSFGVATPQGWDNHFGGPGQHGQGGGRAGEG